MSENRHQYPNNLYDYNEANERRSQNRKYLDNEMNHEHFHCNAANEWNNENNIHYDQQNYAREDRANHEYKSFQSFSDGPSPKNYAYPTQQYKREEIEGYPCDHMSGAHDQMKRYVENTFEIKPKRPFFHDDLESNQYRYHQTPRQSYNYPTYERIHQNRDNQTFNNEHVNFEHSSRPDFTRYDNDHSQEYGTSFNTSSRLPYPDTNLESFESFMSSHSSHDSHYPLITDVNDNDVLCGRGGATNIHLGNRRFRSIVKEYQNKYLSAKKKDKPVVATLVVEMIRKKTPPGRFLKKDKNRNAWYDIGDFKAKEKTSQALREGAPVMRQKRTSAMKTDLDSNPKYEESDMSESGIENGKNCSSRRKVMIVRNQDGEILKSSNEEEYKHNRSSKSDKGGTPQSPKSNTNAKSLSPEEEKLRSLFDPPPSNLRTKPWN